MKLITCFITFCLLFLLSCSSRQEHIKPVRSDITESVYASGIVKALDQYNVFSTVNGILQHIPVHRGDMVKMGDPLFVLENTTSELNAENARLALELSRENNRTGSDKLQEMELNVNLAREKYVMDSLLYLRQKRLWEQNVSSQVDLEQRQLAFTNSKTSYESAYNKLAQLKTQLKNELQHAIVNYNISRKATTDYIIRSNMAGKVYDVLKEEGELVTPQTPLAIVGRADKFLLELDVDEHDIARVQRGQSIAITMDSYKGQVFEGVVDNIHPIMKERSRTFTVEAHFAQLPAVLYPNLTVEANIIIQTKKDALTIPKTYLVDGKYVWISPKEKREVQVGLRDYRKVEILQGIDSSQFIYQPQ